MRVWKWWDGGMMINKSDLGLDSNMGGGQNIPCDLTLNEPDFIDRANCITARYDCGISNYKQSGTGVLNKSRGKYER